MKYSIQEPDLVMSTSLLLYQAHSNGLADTSKVKQSLVDKFFFSSIDQTSVGFMIFNEKKGAQNWNYFKAVDRHDSGLYS